MRLLQFIGPTCSMPVTHNAPSPLDEMLMSFGGCGYVMIGDSEVDDVLVENAFSRIHAIDVGKPCRLVVLLSPEKDNVSIVSRKHDLRYVFSLGPFQSYVEQLADPTKNTFLNECNAAANSDAETLAREIAEEARRLKVLNLLVTSPCARLLWLISEELKNHPEVNVNIMHYSGTYNVSTDMLLDPTEDAKISVNVFQAITAFRTRGHRVTILDTTKVKAFDQPIFKAGDPEAKASKFGVPEELTDTSMLLKGHHDHVTPLFMEPFKRFNAAFNAGLLKASKLVTKTPSGERDALLASPEFKDLERLYEKVTKPSVDMKQLETYMGVANLLFSGDKAKLLEPKKITTLQKELYDTNAPIGDVSKVILLWLRALAPWLVVTEFGTDLNLDQRFGFTSIASPCSAEECAASNFRVMRLSVRHLPDKKCVDQLAVVIREMFIAITKMTVLRE